MLTVLSAQGEDVVDMVRVAASLPGGAFIEVPNPVSRVLEPQPTEYIKARDRIVALGGDAIAPLESILNNGSRPWGERVMAGICLERIQHLEKIRAIVEKDWRQEPSLAGNSGWKTVAGYPSEVGGLIGQQIRDAGLSYYCLELVWKRTEEINSIIDHRSWWRMSSAQWAFDQQNPFVANVLASRLMEWAETGETRGGNYELLDYYMMLIKIGRREDLPLLINQWLRDLEQARQDQEANRAYLEKLNAYRTVGGGLDKLLAIGTAADVEWLREKLDPVSLSTGDREAYEAFLAKYSNSDNVPPVIQLIGVGQMEIQCGTPYTDTGATATDNKDGDLTASITVENNVNATVPGMYTVVYTVSDAGGNTASATRTVNVVDTTAPVLTCQGAQVLKAEMCGGAVNFTVLAAEDQCDGTQDVTCTPASGDALSPGVHTINCSATDSSGNTANCSFTVDVKERLQVRFVAPLADDNVDNNIETDADVVNTFKVGSRVIHKVKLFDCAGNDVTEAYASLVTVKLDVTLRTATNTGSDVVNDVPEVSSGVGNAGGLMIPVGGHFQYNLDTTGYAAGTVNDARFYRSEVTVEWVSAPGLAVGEEDALLESKP
jgi:hypothetical protein